jgi:hypothetical protein
VDQIEYKNGQFTMTASARDRINAMMAEVGQSSDDKLHKLMATTIIGPIKQMADYIEWTGMFFQDQDVKPGEIVRIAKDSPVQLAFYTSSDGQVLFVRPGRGTYSTIDFQMVDAGMEVGWDDLTEAGWNVLEAKMKEVAMEFARKRDAAGLAVLDAACDVVTNHNPSVSGGKMTRTAVDAVFRLAAPTGFKISNVVLNPATMMDQAAWTFASATGMWNKLSDSTGDGALRNFSVSGYGGANWYTFAGCPASKVFFTATPAEMGAYRFRKGGMRTASDVDITRKVDLHTWDEKYGFYLGNPYSVYCLDITA